MSRLHLGVCLFVLFLFQSVGLIAASDGRLIEAVKMSDVQTIRALLSLEDVNTTERDGTTALHWAARNDDREVVELLLDAGANPQAVNRYGVFPLHVACINGNADILEMLLRFGADANAALPAGETAIMTCAKTGDVEALQVLLDDGADVNAKESWHEQTALMWAAAQTHPAAIKLLLEHGADLNAKSKQIDGGQASWVPASSVKGGFTALLFAVREGDIPSVRVLLDAGGTVHETAPDGTNVLVVAILNGHFELAAFLLEKGADPNVLDEKHGSALHALAWVRGHAPGIGMGSASMYPRIPTGNIDGLTLGRKLLEKGANPNVVFETEDPPFEQGSKEATFYYVSNPPDVAIAVSTLNWDGATPFWVAAKNADAPYMRLLADFGADPLQPNRVNVTPLMAAAGAGFMQGEHPGTEAQAFEATKLALELGNDINAIADYGDWNRADLRFDGLTALHGAAQRGASSIVQYLVDRGARLDIKTREGWTPFIVADGLQIGGTLKNSPETADLLEKLMIERGLIVDTVDLVDRFTGDEQP